MSDAADIRIPACTIASNGLPEVPRLSIWAASVEMTSEPATSMINSSTVTVHSFQCGFRNRKMSFIR